MGEYHGSDHVAGDGSESDPQLHEGQPECLELSSEEVNPNGEEDDEEDLRLGVGVLTWQNPTRKRDMMST